MADRLSVQPKSLKPLKEHDMGHLHEAFVAHYPAREAEALRFDCQHDEPKPASAVIGELRLKLARAEQQAADLKRELQFAVDEACNGYWYAGHAQRVERLYGITNQGTAPDCMDTLRLAYRALTGDGDPVAATAQIRTLYSEATGGVAL